MRTEVQEILTDINAATRIGYADSIFIALEKMLSLPEVTGNQVLDETAILNVVRPIGIRLHTRGISQEVLSALSNSREAAFRAVAAVVHSEQYLAGNLDLEVLKGFSKDKRGDVRLAIAKALLSSEFMRLEKLYPVVNAFMLEQSMNYQIIALDLLPSVFHLDSENYSTRIKTLVKVDDPELNAAISKALIELANIGYSDIVFNLLKEFDKRSWIIPKTLSGSWAAERADTVLEIIENIITSGVKNKQIINTLTALKRNGADIVDQTIIHWKSSNNRELVKVAKLYFEQEN